MQKVRQSDSYGIKIVNRENRKSNNGDRHKKTARSVCPRTLGHPIGQFFYVAGLSPPIIKNTASVFLLGFYLSGGGIFYDFRYYPCRACYERSPAAVIAAAPSKNALTHTKHDITAMIALET